MTARSLRNLLWVASALIVVAYLALLATWDDAPFAFTFDDAYYYLGIARNVASGAGSTFDGINPTNGYHPLWLGLATLLFRAGLDDLAAARAALALQLVVGYGGALAVASVLIARATGGWDRLRRGVDEAVGNRRTRVAGVGVAIAFALLAGNPFVVKTFVNGLESGIVVLLYALVLLATPADGRWLGASSRHRLAVGVLLAVTFLGRTDAGLLLACLGVWVLAEVVRGRVWAAGAAALAQLFAVPAVTIAGYLALNQHAFGTPVQVSGLVKRAPLTAGTVATAAVFVAVAAVIGRHGFRRTVAGRGPRRSPRFPTTGALVLRTAWFAAFCVLVVGYYNVLQTQQWGWYYAPVVLYGLVLLALLVVDLAVAALRDAPADRSPARAAAPVLAVVIVPFAVALVWQAPSFGDPDLLSIQIANRRAGEWIRANVPDGAVLASWDAGAVGYFSHAHVVNLDGVVNSYAYYDAARSGSGAGFLRDEGVAFVTNHGAPGDDPDIRGLIREIYGPAAADAARPVYREPFVYDGTTTGSAGSESGRRQLEMYVYAVPSPLAP